MYLNSIQIEPKKITHVLIYTLILSIAIDIYMFKNFLFLIQQNKIDYDKK